MTLKCSVPFNGGRPLKPPAVLWTAHCFAAYFLVIQTASSCPIAFCWLWVYFQHPPAARKRYSFPLSYEPEPQSYGRLSVLFTVCYWLSKSVACPKNMTWSAVFTLILTRLYVVGQSSIFAYKLRFTFFDQGPYSYIFTRERENSLNSTPCVHNHYT